ncbi:hypothetical protein C8F04DRAFT_63475 [Mycena alexandri]|uniref:Uncharacterized protein n=1 Tax=Mycena alexandri TaxID=1745969 RepID=A0AAD6SK45_9AGAR|nr:hypothetical protein C8F04DRAFT_63475 [Mycena alexandri]
MSLPGGERGRASRPQPHTNVEHHAMLVTMIRQTRLIERVRSWEAPDWSDPILLDAAWKEWVRFATIKRALLLAYFHDCCHCMYSASPRHSRPPSSTFTSHATMPSGVPRPLQSGSQRPHTPGIYGVGMQRIYGVSMQRAFKALSTPLTASNYDDDATRLPLTPFWAIHPHPHRPAEYLRRPKSPDAPPGGWSCFAMVAAPVAPTNRVDADADKAEFTFRTQVVLDNWLQLWLTSPETALELNGGGSGAGEQQLPFVCNSLPFPLARAGIVVGELAGRAMAVGGSRPRARAQNQLPFRSRGCNGDPTHEPTFFYR